MFRRHYYPRACKAPITTRWLASQLQRACANNDTDAIHELTQLKTAHSDDLPLVRYIGHGAWLRWLLSAMASNQPERLHRMRDLALCHSSHAAWIARTRTFTMQMLQTGLAQSAYATLDCWRAMESEACDTAVLRGHNFDEDWTFSHLMCNTIMKTVDHTRSLAALDYAWSMGPARSLLSLALQRVARTHVVRYPSMAKPILSWLYQGTQFEPTFVEHQSIVFTCEVMLRNNASIYLAAWMFQQNLMPACRCIHYLCDVIGDSTDWAASTNSWANVDAWRWQPASRPTLTPSTRPWPSLRCAPMCAALSVNTSK
jgi:hypothetical protein